MIMQIKPLSLFFAQIPIKVKTIKRKIFLKMAEITSRLLKGLMVKVTVHAGTDQNIEI